MGMAQLAPYLAAQPAETAAKIEVRALELLGDAPPLVRRMIVLAALV
jgi:hypothetical protein